MYTQSYSKLINALLLLTGTHPKARAAVDSTDGTARLSQKLRS